MQICRSKFPMQEYIDELRPMFKRHWDEIGMAGSHDLELDVNEAHYQNLAERNMYLALVLKTDEGKLIGYLSIVIYSHPHHQSHNFASVDCFMIDVPYRKSNGFKSIIKMFNMAEEILKIEYDVKYFQFNYSLNNPLSIVGKRLGFKDSDILMLKRLEK